MADNPELMKVYYDQAIKLKAKEEKLTELIRATVLSEKADNNLKSNFFNSVSTFNKLLDTLYLEYGYPEYYYVPENLNFPLDSIDMLFLHIELYRISSIGLECILSQSEEIFNQNNPFTSKVWSIVTSDSILNRGQDYHVHIFPGTMLTEPTPKQKFENIKLWRNDELVTECEWDTIRVAVSNIQIIFKPKESGNYRWEADFTVLKPNGMWKSFPSNGGFIVQDQK